MTELYIQKYELHFTKCPVCKLDIIYRKTSGIQKRGSKQVHEKHSKKGNLGHIHHSSAAAAAQLKENTHTYYSGS